MTLEPAHTIARLGFRRWYERQLIEAHAWLVTGFLCSIAIMASIEGVSFRQPLVELLPKLGLLFFGGLICWHAMKRFLVLLAQANRLAEHSTCASCGVYGRFRVVEEYPETMKVSCRQCSHQWMLC